MCFSRLVTGTGIVLPAFAGAGLTPLKKNDMSGSIHPRTIRGFLESGIKYGCWADRQVCRPWWADKNLLVQNLAFRKLKGRTCLCRTLTALALLGPIVKWYTAPFAWVSSGFDSRSVHSLRSWSNQSSIQLFQLSTPGRSTVLAIGRLAVGHLQIGDKRQAW